MASYLDVGAQQTTPGLDVGAQQSQAGLPPAVTEAVSDAIALSDALSTSAGTVGEFSDTIALSDALAIIASGEATVLAADDILAFADSAVANFGIHTPPSLRGNIDYDQIRVSARSGDGPKLLTLKGSFVPGNTVVFDADGNLIDAGHS